MFVFSGTDVRTTPFETSASGAAVYKGNSDNFTVQIEENTNVKVTIPGSEVLGTDLNPNLNTSTLVSQLNGGNGIAEGSFTITDRSGYSRTISITSSMTIGQVITTISASSNLTASINSSGDGITITDTSSVINQSLTVSEVGDGTTASSLGILGRRDGNLEGINLNATLSEATLISELNGGQGLTLGNINLVNGAASGTVSLSSATTIGEVISQINNAGHNVTASINSAGNALQVTSNNSSTVVVVNNIGTDTTAEELGIGGGRNVINTLFKLKQAMEYDDTFAILGSLANLDSGLETINHSRAIYGAVARRIMSTEATHQQNIVNQKDQISNIEGADLVEAASEFAAMEAALQASLSSTARIIQPSLLDFLR